MTRIKMQTSYQLVLMFTQQPCTKYWCILISFSVWTAVRVELISHMGCYVRKTPLCKSVTYFH